MCGIVGFVGVDARAEESREAVTKMLDTQQHRGPDNTGLWTDAGVTLGHNRLSIIDLGESSHQPMAYGDLMLTFNGEIYNYRELAQDLTALGCTFQTKSDSEVILAAYQTWGERCVERFVGMWAFAIWDKRTKTLFCSRDRFGIKPFFYVADLPRFYFASEVKALKAYPGVSSAINPNQLSLYLQLGWYFNHDETLYQDVKLLPGAHNLVYKDGKLTIYEYWNIEQATPTAGSFEDKVGQFEDLFLNSIDLHLRSDVTVGSSLSGGIDSSSIVSVCGKRFPDSKMKAFHIYFDGEGEVDERPWVESLNKQYPNLETHYYSPGGGELGDEFGRFMHHMEFPTAGSSTISQYFVMKLAGKHGMKVLLDGQGADEFLAGYMHDIFWLLAGKVRKGQFLGFGQQLLHHARTQQLGTGATINVMMRSLASSLLSQQKATELEYQRKYPHMLQEQLSLPLFRMLSMESGSPLSQQLYHQTRQSSLPNLLHHEDRNSMAYSIESRVPFLDHRLVEFAFSLRDSHKWHNGVTKRVLRESMRNYLPEMIKTRTDKKGFVTPGETKWLKKDLKFLLDFNPKELPLLNAQLVQQELNAYRHGDQSKARLIWRFASLNYWNKNIL